MMGLKMLTIVNSEAILLEMIPLNDDLVDSWDPSVYADQQFIDAPEWGCGIQPWSRGNPAARAGITEREWRQRDT